MVPVLALSAVDAFDLPEWLGTEQVVWTAESGLRSSHHVVGTLSSGPASDAAHRLACDLVAVDEAYPQAVADEDVRQQTHRAWHDGQVLVGLVGERVTLALPGTRVGVDVAFDALARLARAVGADPERYALLLRIGSDARASRR
ncbi:MAG: hypothetical protein ACI379_06210 [Nocardioides sp.]|uniref:hypothetical protein n=1 Tax=Nocardioides sp. TaxID=35761 RepID=UPI003F033C19